MDRLGLTHSEVADAAWAIHPEGQRWRGAGAINIVLQTITGFPFSGLYGLPVIRQIQDRLYELIARNRRRLPGTIPHCKEFPADCVADSTLNQCGV